ncbi:MAG: ATP-binding cassette domain-containing protein, partial [Candidatus Enteromonas sp.]
MDFNHLDKLPSSECALEINELHKSYGKKEVIQGLNLQVKKGEVFGFLGKNGVGKSTTIDCVIGCKKFQSGEIKILGDDILLHPLEAKAHFGYVASEPN